MTLPLRLALPIPLVDLARRGRVLRASCAAATPFAVSAQTTLRAVMHSDLKIVDPIFTTAYITRNHGYMIYDTLFATDAKGEVQPQMVDKYTVSDDKLKWTFTLRDGLLFHDGAPVTSEDVIASLQRWGSKDATGQKLMSFVKAMTPVDPKTFEISLNSPTGLMLLALGKPSSNVPFIMPKRIAADHPAASRSRSTSAPARSCSRSTSGSPATGRSTSSSTSTSRAASRRRASPAATSPRSTGSSGSPMPEQQTAVNALIAGEIDLIEQPPPRPAADAREGQGRQAARPEPARATSTRSASTSCRSRSTTPRSAPRCSRRSTRRTSCRRPSATRSTTRSARPCSSAARRSASEKGMKDKLESNMKKATDDAEGGGYDGTPVVLLHSTDLQVLTNLAPVAKSLMERPASRSTCSRATGRRWSRGARRRIRPRAGGWNAC